MILLSLLWWKQSGDTKNEQWQLAVADVTWALRTMLVHFASSDDGANYADEWNSLPARAVGTAATTPTAAAALSVAATATATPGFAAAAADTAVTTDAATTDVATGDASPSRPACKGAPKPRPRGKAASDRVKGTAAISSMRTRKRTTEVAFADAAPDENNARRSLRSQK